MKETGKLSEDLDDSADAISEHIPTRSRLRHSNQAQESVCSRQVHSACWTLNQAPQVPRGLTWPRVHSRIGAMKFIYDNKKAISKVGNEKNTIWRNLWIREEITVETGNHREVNNKENATNPDLDAATAELQMLSSERRKCENHRANSQSQEARKATTS